MVEPVNEKEEDLIRKAIQGDGEAFTRLYDMYVDKVYRHISYRVGRVADVEDLTQEVFLRAWRSVGSYQPGEKPFVAWLYVISHNLVVDHYRKRGREHMVPLDEMPAAAEAQHDPELDLMLDQDAVRRMLVRLSGDEQQVLMLRFVEGLDYTQVAASLGKSQGAVRVIQLRALRRLRQQLQEEGSR